MEDTEEGAKRKREQHNHSLPTLRQFTEYYFRSEQNVFIRLCKRPLDTPCIAWVEKLALQLPIREIMAKKKPDQGTPQLLNFKAASACFFLVSFA